MLLSFEQINDLLNVNIKYSSDRQMLLNNKRDVNCCINIRAKSL